MSACPFCDYTGPSCVIAKSETSYAIEPLSPVCDGHLLVIPWLHIEDFVADPFLTGQVAADAARIAQEFCDGDANFITSKGPLATQTVKHLHVHLVPRREGDGLVLPWVDLPESKQDGGES